MSDKQTEASHAARDNHLFGPGPKRILSLDGGGVRGAISVAFLDGSKSFSTNIPAAR